MSSILGVSTVGSVGGRHVAKSLSVIFVVYYYYDFEMNVNVSTGSVLRSCEIQSTLGSLLLEPTSIRPSSSVAYFRSGEAELCR